MWMDVVAILDRGFLAKRVLANFVPQRFDLLL